MVPEPRSNIFRTPQGMTIARGRGGWSYENVGKDQATTLFGIDRGVRGHVSMSSDHLRNIGLDFDAVPNFQDPYIRSRDM